MVSVVRISLLVIFELLTASLCNSLVLDGGSDNSNPRLDALEYMLVEEKQLRAQLETKVNDLQRSVASVSSAQTECGCSGSEKKDHPAFLATFTSSDGFDCHALQAVIFDNVQLNAGSAYNPNHGTFTAPVSGNYAFQTSLSSPPNTSFHVAFVQNVTSNEIGYLFNQATTMWKKRSTSTVTHLLAGEEVWMICLADSHIPGHIGHSWHGAGEYHSHFSGFLINAD